MSAIFGIYNRDDKPVDRNDLDEMATSLYHRGKDDQGVWLNCSIGIGHQMFYTTPEALHEKLPYTDIESKISISCDVRLDNRDELISQLACQRTNQNVITDSYLILESYKKWGINCPRHLLGDFAFVIWDERIKKIFCARDHMGVKPFSYYLSDEQFVFASEAPAVLTVSGVPEDLNEGRIADFLLDLEGIDKTSTFYKQIHRLPPAHSMVVTKDKVSIDCYWTLDPKKEIIFNSDEEYIEAFNAIYVDAIDKRLRGNNDVASMLSGGIDSSSIVAIAKDLYHSKTGKKFSVFSATSDKSKDSEIETNFINIVRNIDNLETNIIDSNEISKFNDSIHKVSASLPEPFDLMVMIIVIYLLANQSGKRVVLDGVEGDMIYSLPSNYVAFLLKTGQWRNAFREIKGQVKNSYNGNSSFTEILIQNFRSAFTPLFLRKLKRKIYRLYSAQKLKNPEISTSFTESVNIEKREKLFNSHSCQGLCHTLREQHINSMTHPNLTVALERYDRIAAQCGIEPRHPLLDKRLVEFMVAIPWNQKTRNGRTKFLLRKSSERIVPKEVCWRTGYEHVGWDFEETWLKMNHSQILRDICKNTAIKKYFNTKNLDSACTEANFNENDQEHILFIEKVYLLHRLI